MAGPEVTARPGTKRHLKQLRARSVFLSIQAVTAAGSAKRAQAAYEAAQERTNAVQACVELVETLYLAVAEPHGNA